MAGFPVRAARQSDGAFLADMVVEAANWRAGGARPRHEILDSDEHRRYIAGWMRPGDAGFIAESPDGEAIGATWYRVFPRTDPGFGYVGTRVPELIIGVRPLWRAHGVGRLLLRRLAEQARAEGYARLSLSVDRDNYAVTLYRGEGFAVVQRGPARDTMVRRLH